ncbi:PD-(D/E)XK nuclease family protein [Nitratireductor aquibiodomus]|uniref:PD-(D/E)XK nuclease family protein n=1 Tax=Nitratireductor aquibiodomus TaxID=204799 RepID=UPI00138E3B88|nr:PD-(D/E)XK nuclease family protein [Nitratireductor aquibiodomus]
MSDFEGLSVFREKNNIDITIFKNDEPILIIENKIKDIVKIDQLKHYSEKIQGRNVRRFVISIADPLDCKGVLNEIGWECKQYKELSKYIINWAYNNSSIIKESHYFYIKEYAEMIFHLGSIGDEYFRLKESGEKYWFCDWGVFEKLDRIGFGQTLKKYQASAFRQEISNFLREERYNVFDGINDNLENYVNVWSGLFNSTPCVTFEPRLGGASNIVLEIQVQGGQYRHIIVNKNKNKSLKCSSDEKTLEVLRGMHAAEWLFGSEVKSEHGNKYFQISCANGTQDRISTSMRKRLCRYGDETVYQYLNISAGGEADDQSPVPKLKKWILRDVETAFRILKKIRSL